MNQTPGNGTAGDGGGGRGPHATAPPAGSEDAASAETTRSEGAGGADMIADQAARIAELEDARLRAVADLDNMRKRCSAQIRRAEEDARVAVARQWLPVIDSLDLALAHATADPATIVDGVEAVREQALGVLARLGFPRRDDRGARFDPTRHEAVATRPDPGTEADMVAEVVRPGYGDGDHQLRPAQVVVARPG
ncbi:MAG TPA: nucleotide exchange factor GrpE [Trebonia sp.]|nr:nucleotide exchange factor GrpE [Trebonia sp.]